MRVLLVCFRLGSGGPGIYVPNLAQNLSQLGCKVGIFFTGEHDFFLRTRLESTVADTEIAHYNLINSPNFHTGVVPVGPLADLRNPTIEGIFRKVLLDFQPDVIHIHDLGGLCISLLDIAAEYAPVVNSLHSYALLCQQNHLIDQTTMLACAGAGERCVDCMDWSPAKQRRLHFLHLVGRARRFVNVRLKPRLGLKAKPFNLNVTSSRGWNADLSEGARRALAGDYRDRTSRAVELMSKRANVNLAVSEAVARIYKRFGVAPDRIAVQHIGTRAAEEFSPLPLRRSAAPIVGYIGSIVFIKGAKLLIDAFSRLPAHNPIRLHVHGYGSPELIAELRGRSDPSRVTFFGAYSHKDLPHIMSNVDAVVVPPVWEDNAPQTVFEALALGRPVIGAKIGGIPDFVQHEKNGLLFEAGNPAALAQAINRLAEPGMVERLSAGITSMKTMRDHAVELDGLYRKLIAGSATIAAS